MPLTGTHKTDLQAAQTALIAFRASLSIGDQQQKEVAGLVDQMLRDLTLIADVRSK